MSRVLVHQLSISDYFKITLLFLGFRYMKCLWLCAYMFTLTCDLSAHLEK